MSKKDKAFRKDFGYACRYTHTVMDGPVFRWGNDFEVSASRNGVMVNGHSFCMKAAGVQNLENLLWLAESVHRQLTDHEFRKPLLFGENDWVELEDTRSEAVA